MAVSVLLQVLLFVNLLRRGFCSLIDRHIRDVLNYELRACGGTLMVAQLVEALRYKTEGQGFDSRWYHWNFSLTQTFRPHCGPGVDSASNRN